MSEIRCKKSVSTYLKHQFFWDDILSIREEEFDTSISNSLDVM
ncbi:hypothetical protein SCG7086_AV_00100 [Chlamydiales bacterium SCGC AG-110-P3]|nr:hypothetical protein SCG7086_AV_00100 [Chlamydiales bacterium SCGC AG-110-P3]